MKKRQLVTALFALLLCALTCPAKAAVESGGVSYLWYTQDGRQTWENGQVVAFSGERFFLSADGGATYAEFPEFQAASRQGWTDYDVRVTALDAGGLRVEARREPPIPSVGIIPPESSPRSFPGQSPTR